MNKYISNYLARSISSEEEYNPILKKLIIKRSIINHLHYNKVFKKKLELDDNLKIKFIKIERLKNRYWNKKEKETK